MGALPAHQMASPATSLRFGILGAADIAKKFCESVKGSPAATIHGIASRSLERAEAFAIDHCPQAKRYGSYDDILADPEVDAVYLPMPTAHRTAWALKAAAAGKHILSEKPVAPTAAEAHQVTTACAAAGVMYMDNTMFMHHTRTAALTALIADPAKFGTPKVVSSCFSVSVPDEALNANIRSQASCEPLGALGDLGWYSIRFSLMAYQFEQPEAVSCHFHELSNDGVPLSVSCVMRFSNNRLATFDASFKANMRQWAEVSSDTHTAHVDDFVVPYSETTSLRLSSGGIGEKALFFEKTVVEESAYSCLQHTAAVDKFSEMSLSGQHEAHWPAIALQTQVVCDACMASGNQDGAWVAVPTKE